MRRALPARAAHGEQGDGRGRDERGNRWRVEGDRRRLLLAPRREGFGQPAIEGRRAARVPEHDHPELEHHDEAARPDGLTSERGGDQRVQLGRRAVQRLGRPLRAGEDDRALDRGHDQRRERGRPGRIDPSALQRGGELLDPACERLGGLPAGAGHLTLHGGRHDGAARREVAAGERLAPPLDERGDGPCRRLGVQRLHQPCGDEVARERGRLLHQVGLSAGEVVVDRPARSAGVLEHVRERGAAARRARG